MRATWLDDGSEIHRATLNEEGIHATELPTDEAGWAGPIAELKAARGYIEQDVVELRPDTPNLDAICDKFAGEHLHTDDEVRFVLDGEGVFDIRSRGDRWMHVVVEPGDLIVVPRDRHHRFLLTESRAIRCVRLFQDAAGWVPHYRQ